MYLILVKIDTNFVVLTLLYILALLHVHVTHESNRTMWYCFFVIRRTHQDEIKCCFVEFSLMLINLLPFELNQKSWTDSLIGSCRYGLLIKLKQRFCLQFWSSFHLILRENLFGWHVRKFSRQFKLIIFWQKKTNTGPEIIIIMYINNGLLFAEKNTIPLLVTEQNQYCPVLSQSFDMKPSSNVYQEFTFLYIWPSKRVHFLFKK